MKNVYGTLYTVAGYSKGPDGRVKFRVANSMARAAVLVRNGHTEVSLLALPMAMSKEAARQFVDGKGVLQNLGKLGECVARGRKNTRVVNVPTQFMVEMTGAKIGFSEKMTSKEAAQVRAEFNERVRIAYEAN